MLTRRFLPLLAFNTKYGAYYILEYNLRNTPNSNLDEASVPERTRGNTNSRSLWQYPSRANVYVQGHLMQPR